MGRHLDEGPRSSGVQVIFVSGIARSAAVLHQPIIEPDDVKWRLASLSAVSAWLFELTTPTLARGLGSLLPIGGWPNARAQAWLPSEQPFTF
jgi:hypothetical protein